MIRKTVVRVMDNKASMVRAQALNLVYIVNELTGENYPYNEYVISKHSDYYTKDTVFYYDGNVVKRLLKRYKLRKAVKSFKERYPNTEIVMEE